MRPTVGSESDKKIIRKYFKEIYDCKIRKIRYVTLWYKTEISVGSLKISYISASNFI